MPYNPGITYDTQSLAQGIQQAGQNIATGLREYEANKRMASDALAKFEATAAANPDILKFLDAGNAPAGAASAYKSLTSGGTLPVQKAAMLAQFADTFAKQRAAAQEQQMQKLQIEQFQRQASQIAQQQAQDNLARQYGQGTGAGVLSPQLQNNPFFKLNAQSLAGGSGRLTGDQVLDHIAKEDAISGKGSKNQPQEVTLPSGAKVAFSPSTGGFSVLPQAAEALGKAEMAKTEAETSAKSASALLNDITDTAENARHTIGTVDRILSLYDAGAQSGFAQPTLTQARAALARFGLAKEGLGNQQQFEKELNALVLERGKELMKGGGAVSNYEREAVQKASANAGLTPEANKQILGVLKAIAERSVKMDELRTKLEDDGKSNVEISKAIRKLRDTMPIGVDNLPVVAPDAAEPNATTATPAQSLAELARAELAKRQKK